jgi:ABC-type antimicrobial peptide transport system permease subunit
MSVQASRTPSFFLGLARTRLEAWADYLHGFVGIGSTRPVRRGGGSGDRCHWRADFGNHASHLRSPEAGVSIGLLAISVAIAVAVGVLSGLYPAWRSSRLRASLALQG